MGRSFRVLAAAGALGLVLGSAAPALAVSDPSSNEWWFSTLNVQQDVWPVTQGQGVTVAVLDSGVNGELPEIASALLPGGDMTGQNTDGRSDFDTKSGHGTSMAVLIAGQGGGRTGLVGLAPRAKILPVAVDNGLTTPALLSQTLAAGIRYATDHGATVINMSVGEPVQAADSCPAAVMDAIGYAAEHDVVMVAGAGNQGAGANPAEFPASCAGVLTVGAVDRQSNPWSDDESQSYVSVAAPGVDMATTGSNPAIYYPHSSGTSNASALVSAEAALVRAAQPSLSAREVVHRIIATAGGNASSPNDQTGFGAVSVERAISSSTAIPANSPNPPYERLDQWRAAQSPSSPQPSSPAESSAATTPATSAASKHGSGGSNLLPLYAVIFVLAIVGGMLIRARVTGTGPWRHRSAGASAPQPPPSQPPPPPPAVRPNDRPGPPQGFGPQTRPDFRPHDEPGEGRDGRPQR